MQRNNSIKNEEAKELSEQIPDSEKAVSFKKEIIGWVKFYILALVLIVALKRYVVVNATVISGSMENTLMVEDKISAYRLSYLFEEPVRGDIVMFAFPDDESRQFIKRIIGLPGESIEGKNGIVYIDGEPLSEDYITEDLNEDFGPYEIPEYSYFMMGDNRGISLDSRYWNNHFVKKEKITGKAIFKYYPQIKLLK